MKYDEYIVLIVILVLVVVWMFGMIWISFRIDRKKLHELNFKQLYEDEV